MLEEKKRNVIKIEKERERIYINDQTKMKYK